MYTDFSAQLVLDVVLEESDAVLPYVPPTKPEVASFQELHSHALGTTKEPLSQQIDRFHRMQGHHLEMESCDSDMDALPSFTGILNPPEAGPGYAPSFIPTKWIEPLGLSYTSLFFVISRMK